jgi:hypothetical protein
MSPSWIARSSLTESGITRDAGDVTNRVAKISDPVAAEGTLECYTAGRYSDGRWISAAVLKRVPHAAAEATGTDEAQPRAGAKGTTRAKTGK